MAGGSGRGVEHYVPPPPPGRAHVWVKGPVTARGPHAGLVLRWRRCPEQGWQAWTVYYIETEDTLVTQWVHAALLTPVGPHLTR